MCLFWTQRKIFWRMCESEQFWGTIDFRSIFFFLLWKLMLPQKQPGYKLSSEYLQIKSNQITFIVTSPQHKCLGEWNSYERAPDSAKKQQTIYLWTDSAKKQQTIYLWTDSAKKQQTIYIWTDSAKKTALEHLQCSRQCKKTTTAIYIWTDSAKNNSNLHMDRQCKKQQQFTYGQTVQKTTAIYIWTVHIYRLYRRQCAKYTYIYSVRLVYYRDILNYQRHIIHRMGTSALCTVSIHNVVYT